MGLTKSLYMDPTENTPFLISSQQNSSDRVATRLSLSIVASHSKNQPGSNIYGSVIYGLVDHHHRGLRSFCDVYL
jgi:hypothetical protein